MLLGHLEQLVALVVLNLVVFEVPELVVVLLVLLEPQLHHRRPADSLLVQSSPPRWFLQLLHRDVVLSHGLVLPLEGLLIDFGPQREVLLEVELVVLVAAGGCEEDLVLGHPDRFVVECGAARDVVSVRVLHLDEQEVQVLGPLEGRS